MIKKVRQYWKKHYNDKLFTVDKPKPVIRISPLEIQLGNRSGHSTTTHHSDAFMEYIHQPTTGNVDVLNWWAEYGPIELQRIAFDILSIPAMSAEVERVLSSTKRTLTPDRNALTIESLEIIELLWWRGDIVLQKSDSGEVEEEKSV